MKLKIITYTRSLFSKIRIRSRLTTNLKTGKTTHSVSPKTGIRRFRVPRCSTTKRIRVGRYGRCTITTGPRTGTRISTSHSTSPKTRGRTRVRIVHSTSVGRTRIPRARTYSPRIRAPRIRRSFSARPRIRACTGIRRRFSTTPKIRTTVPRIRTGSYRARRRY